MIISILSVLKIIKWYSNLEIIQLILKYISYERRNFWLVITPGSRNIVCMESGYGTHPITWECPGMVVIFLYYNMWSRGNKKNLTAEFHSDGWTETHQLCTTPWVTKKWLWFIIGLFRSFSWLGVLTARLTAFRVQSYKNMSLPKPISIFSQHQKQIIKRLPEFWIECKKISLVGYKTSCYSSFYDIVFYHFKVSLV